MLPGLGTGDLKVYFEDRHFTCSDLIFEGEYSTRTCTRYSYDGLTYYHVQYSTKHLPGVDVVDAAVLQYGEPDDVAAADFLSAVAAFPYDGAEPDKAGAWVKAWLGSGARTATFGGVPFALSGGPAARTLTIGRLEE